MDVDVNLDRCEEEETKMFEKTIKYRENWEFSKITILAHYIIYYVIPWFCYHVVAACCCCF